MTHIPDGWQPIETAPKDSLIFDGLHHYGTKIIVFDGSINTVRWWRIEDDSASNFIDEGGRAIYPTHWMPLPEAPSAEQDAAIRSNTGDSALLCAARAVVAADDAQALTSQLINVLRAACDAAAVGDAREAHFDLWQDGMVVASASGPRAQALQEIQHYAAVYSQDGPVQIEEVIRIPLNAAQQGE
ncbi:DUF551 domain-containing protein, partial [Achromobacter sp. Marseille-Q0513]|uniref:DUF551 domain-containing protein n=1 Tax=Achromobacter sp. Marseille-Q0513 TaxID=2829161 RepID=UPI001B9AED8F